MSTHQYRHEDDANLWSTDIVKVYGTPLLSKKLHTDITNID